DPAFASCATMLPLVSISISGGESQSARSAGGRRSPPSPIGFSKLTFGPATNPSSDMEISRTTIPPSAAFRVSIFLRMTFPSLTAADDVVVKMRVTDHTLEQTHPERHHHFCAARGCDVADVDDVVDLPAEPIVQIFGDFVLRVRVVAADE